MSNNQRYSSKGLPNKTQQQMFVPNLNSKTTLSDSLRQQPHSYSSGSTGSSSRRRRIQGGDGGSGKFVHYLPQDEAVAAGLGAVEGGLDPVESQGVVDLLNRECSLLLKLNPKDFWREVSSDTSLHAFLESFLKYRSRWYDFPYRGARGIVAGVIINEHELSRRVFMILYRISSNRDPGAKASDILSPKDHTVILQGKKLLDLPKLLDICAIYGRENEELTRIIVTNAIKAQPGIHDSFSVVISHFLNIAHTMYERCSTSLEVLFSSHDTHDDGSARLHTDYLEVMDFINDAIVSMDALVTAYKQAAVYFSCSVETSYGSDELFKVLARLHDSLLPSLYRGFQIIFSAKKDGHQIISSNMLPKVISSLKMLSFRLVGFCWKLLNICYLSEEIFQESIPLPPATKIFPAQVEDPVIRADILVQTFREINVESSTVNEGRSANTLLQSVEKNFQLMDRLELLQKEGWISMDSEQLQFLSGIMLVHGIREISHLSSEASKKVEMDEDNAIMESKISQVKDLFPDYGKGFISACLEVYNQNPEEVIQRILEGTLHSDLLSLDTSLDVVPHKTTAPPVSRNDKGKGKLVELPTETPMNVASSLAGKSLLEGPSSTSSSSVGRFIRKSTTNMPDQDILNTKDKNVKTVALQSLLEYEDEYDDSFDDLGLSVVDSGLDDLSEKVNSSETSASDASRWGSRQKPQFYVKDGKNYSYKVSGSVAAANYNEASIVNQAQKELIHGLGRGGNFPLGAAQKVMEMNQGKYDMETEGNETSARRGGRNNNRRQDHNTTTMKSNHEEVGGRGNSTRGGWGRGNIVKEQQTLTKSTEREESNVNESVTDEHGRGGRGRGRGRRGGGRSNNYRKDQAMKKHFSGLGGI